MGGSLRDQLLEAGFSESGNRKNQPKKKHRKSKKSRPGRNTQPLSEKVAEDAAAQAERKRVKTEIKALIEANRVKEIQGDLAYSFILGKRVKQIFINQPCLEKIARQELAITRLNGSTHLIPVETADKVRALNPDWAIVIAEDKDSEDKDGYAEYAIPDDLHW